MATNVADAGHVVEVVDDVRDSYTDLKRAENDLLDSQLTLQNAKREYRDAEIDLLLAPTPVDPNTTKPLTVPQREAWIEHELGTLQDKIDQAERAVRAHSAALRIAQENCRTNRVILQALTGLRGE